MFTEKLFEKRKYLILSLILLTFFCFYNAIFMEFVWDDISHYSQFTKRIRDFSSLLKFFSTTNIVGEPFYYRPLMLISYGLDYLIYKNHPFGYHITSILLHIANTILVFLITEKLLNKKIAFLSSLLFAVHPVHCEPVVWISARADLLSALFSFLSFYFYIHFNEKQTVANFLLTLLFFTLTIFTKETSLMMFLIYLIFPFVKKRKFTKTDLALLICCFIIIISYLFIREQVVGGLVFDHYSLDAKFATIPIVLISYFKLFFYPFDLHLLYDKPMLLAEATLESIISLIILVLIALITYLICDRNRLFAFFIIFYFIFLLPVSGVITFVRISLIADRYIYFPSYGLTVISSYCLIKIYDFPESKYLKTFLKAAITSLIILLSVTAIIRNKEWNDNLSVLQKMLKEKRDFNGAWLQLGSFYANAKMFKEAEKAFNMSLIFSGVYDKPRALNNLCNLYHIQKKYDLAEKSCLEGIKIDKTHPKLYTNLANIYIDLNRYNDAYYAILGAIQYDLGNPDLYNLASYIAMNIGKQAVALSLIDKAIELDPSNDGFKKNRSILVEMLEFKSPPALSN